MGGGGATGVPTSGGPAVPGSGASLPPARTRGPTAVKLLALDWQYPVYTPPVDDGPTVAKRMRAALPAGEAFAVVAGDDPRPLLVLRECKECNGTDRALLTRNADNERTILLSRWFRCVKLPMDVREEDHPFYALFPKKDAEHLFVSTRDGSVRIALESDTSRVELWKAMSRALEASYKKSPDAALKKLTKMLDDFDVLDERRVQLVVRQNEILEKDGPKSRKLAGVNRELAEVEGAVERLRAELAKASELELQRPAVPAGATEQGAGTSG